MNSARSVGATVVLIIGLIGQWGCVDDRDAAMAHPVRVAVPVSPIAGLVRELAPAAELEVIVLVPVGSNPATHSPSIEDQRRAADAQVYLEIGHPSFPFEQTWLDGLLEGSAVDRVPLFDDCPLLEDDPHVWVSVSCLSGAARVTAGVLRRLFPAQELEIERNLDEFEQRLASTAASADSLLKDHAGKSFIVLHPAWGYFARDYGLRQIEILSHGSGDSGAAHLAELIQAGKNEGVTTVFTQPQFNPAPADIVAAELNATTAVLDPLQEDPIRILKQAAEALERAFEERSR